MRDPDQPYRPSAAASELPERAPGGPFDPERSWSIPDNRLLSIEELAAMTTRLIAACGGAILLVLGVIWLPVNAIELYLEFYSGLSDVPIVLQIGLWAVDIVGGLGLLFVARDRLLGDKGAEF